MAGFAKIAGVLVVLLGLPVVAVQGLYGTLDPCEILAAELVDEARFEGIEPESVWHSVAPEETARLVNASVAPLGTRACLSHLYELKLGAGADWTLIAGLPRRNDRRPFRPADRTRPAPAASSPATAGRAAKKVLERVP